VRVNPAQRTALPGLAGEGDLEGEECEAERVRCDGGCSEVARRRRAAERGVTPGEVGDEGSESDSVVRSMTDVAGRCFPLVGLPW
jgi:hypothetical protein